MNDNNTVEYNQPPAHARTEPRSHAFAPTQAHTYSRFFIPFDLLQMATKV